MTRPTLLLFLAAIPAALCTGLWVGAREGARLGELVAEPLRAQLAARALTDMKSGNTRLAGSMFEFEVDRGLLSVNQFDESSLDRFLALRFVGPVIGMPSQLNDLDSFAARAASYRKANPSPFISGESFAHFPGETPERGAMIDDATDRRRETTRIINLMVERYGAK